MSLTARKTGTLQGSAAFLLGLLNLPGSSGSYMALGTSHPTNFDTSSTNFFIECWVYLNALPAATKVYYIVLRGTGVYGAEDIGLRILPSGFAEFYSYGAGNTIAIPNSGTALSLNTWYHLAGSIDSLTKTVYIFLNGVLKNSASMAGAPRTTAGSNFFIGTPTIQNDWVAANCYIQDMRVVRGGSVPKLSFTPSPSTFGYFNLLAPPYVPGGTCVLCLLPQYFPNTPTSITPSGIAGGYGANVTGGDLTQIIAGNKVHFFTTVGTQTITVTGYGYVTVLIVAARVGGGSASRSRAKKSAGKGVPMFVVIEPKQHRGATYTLSSVLAIGRLEDNDIVIDDDSFISSHHARIEIRPEGTWVVDLGSTNGCYVNGQRVADERSVRKGDRIQVGSTVLEMRS
jgi:hypothetical protein